MDRKTNESDTRRHKKPKQKIFKVVSSAISSVDVDNDKLFFIKFIKLFFSCFALRRKRHKMTIAFVRTFCAGAGDLSFETRL